MHMLIMRMTLYFPSQEPPPSLVSHFSVSTKGGRRKRKKNLHAHLHSFVFLLLKNPSNSLTRHGSKHLLCSLYVISNLIVLVFGFATANQYSLSFSLLLCSPIFLCHRTSATSSCFSQQYVLLVVVHEIFNKNRNKKA